MITSINQTKFKRTREGHAWGYGPGKRVKIEPSLKKLLDRSSPQARNARFAPGSNVMDKILEAFVPPVIKKDPRPSNFEDMLVACCRRKQEYDEKGRLVMPKNLKFKTLN